ncbi:MAG: hypothetical protein HOD92_05565 [Deltaproteobacteria bacterium]|jgi:hypothetical protein|nr:hypothetical protein [Deltaproteobacteria bacterium]MBT4525333.1 hypothetical protein [Deltaproteobacteria bacterium]
MNESDIITAINPIVKAFENLGVQYYIGGSVASSAYGIARATLDVDLVSNLKTKQVPGLIKVLKKKYYINEQSVVDAIQHSSSFNLIHLETMLKVDVFILKNTPYDLCAFSRKQIDTLDDQNKITFFLGSAEDIILNKLNWFKKGDCISDQQWKDILGIIKVQQKQLDQDYLRHWAKILDLWKLFQKAFDDAGILND